MTQIELNIDGAYDFYKRYLLDVTKDKTVLYKKYGFKMPGSILSRDWELFAAILLNDRAKGDVGSDLERRKIKFAMDKGSFEYEYHRNHGLEKLAEDKLVDHVFISYTRDYADIEVWRVDGETFAPIFDSWLPGLIDNYSGSSPRQRHRKSIPFGIVRKEGSLLLRVQQGLLVFP